MLKLLLQKDRYLIKKEFLYRFLNIFLFFTILGLIVMFILMSASFLLIFFQSRTVEQQINHINQSDNSLRREELRDLEKELQKNFLIFNNPTPEYSGFIAEIMNMSNDEILFNSMNFNMLGDEGSNVIEIELRGVADTRSVLVNYVDALRESESFKSVNLPISNLTRDTNLSFVLSIVTNNLIIK